LSGKAWVATRLAVFYYSKCSRRSSTAARLQHRPDLGTEEILGKPV
jgi:hypothetical protein